MRDINFEYCVSINYNRGYHCEEQGCDSICRCSTLESVAITDVDINQITKKIYDFYFDDSRETKRDILLNSILFDTNKEVCNYIIDRIIRYHKVWDADNWYAEIENGYYGEEIEGVFMKNDFRSEVEYNIETVLSMEELSKKINFLLKLEYGIILPKLKNKNYKLETVLKSDLIFGNISHHDNVKEKDLKFYSDSNYNGIRGIVIKKDDDKYKIIDGYHRCYSTNKEEVTVLVAY